MGYLLQVTLPNGARVSCETAETALTQTVETYAMGGGYGRQASALGGDGGALCTAGAFTFSKLVCTPQATEKSKGEKGKEEGVDDGGDDLG